MKFNLTFTNELKYFAYIRENGDAHGAYGNTKTEALQNIIIKLKYSVTDAEERINQIKEIDPNYDIQDDWRYVYKTLDRYKKCLDFVERKLRTIDKAVKA